MLTFGLVSSIFDYLTFGRFAFVLHAGPEEFRTGWFIESVISAALIVLVVRTRRPFFKSWPSRYLVIATLCVVVLTLLIPYVPGAQVLGFTPLPLLFLAALAVLVALYIAAAEITKRIFYKHVRF